MCRQTFFHFTCKCTDNEIITCDENFSPFPGSAIFCPYYAMDSQDVNAACPKPGHDIQVEKAAIVAKYNEQAKYVIMQRQFFTQFAHRNEARAQLPQTDPVQVSTTRTHIMGKMAELNQAAERLKSGRKRELEEADRRAELRADAQRAQPQGSVFYDRTTFNVSVEREVGIAPPVQHFAQPAPPFVTPNTYNFLPQPPVLKSTGSPKKRNKPGPKPTGKRLAARASESPDFEPSPPPAEEPPLKRMRGRQPGVKGKKQPEPDLEPDLYARRSDRTRGRKVNYTEPTSPPDEEEDKTGDLNPDEGQSPVKQTIKTESPDLKLEAKETPDLTASAYHGRILSEAQVQAAIAKSRQAFRDQRAAIVEHQSSHPSRSNQSLTEATATCATNHPPMMPQGSASAAGLTSQPSYLDHNFPQASACLSRPETQNSEEFQKKVNALQVRQQQLQMAHLTPIGPDSSYAHQYQQMRNQPARQQYATPTNPSMATPYGSTPQYLTQANIMTNSPIPMNQANVPQYSPLNYNTSLNGLPPLNAFQRTTHTTTGWLPAMGNLQGPIHDQQSAPMTAQHNQWTLPSAYAQFNTDFTPPTSVAATSPALFTVPRNVTSNAQIPPQNDGAEYTPLKREDCEFIDLGSSDTGALDNDA